MRKLRLLTFLFASTLVFAQGLSPKAGAVSEGLYTNLYFGMNYKLPADWVVSFVAMDGACERECVLLDVRAPEERSRRALTVTAEQLGAGSGLQQVAFAGVTLEKLGAKKIASPKQVSIAGRSAYRADYSSMLGDTEVYYTIIVIPAKEYSIVFSFSSESRKHLDTLADTLPKAINFTGQS